MACVKMNECAERISILVGDIPNAVNTVITSIQASNDPLDRYIHEVPVSRRLEEAQPMWPESVSVGSQEFTDRQRRQDRSLVFFLGKQYCRRVRLGCQSCRVRHERVRLRSHWLLDVSCRNLKVRLYRIAPGADTGEKDPLTKILAKVALFTSTLGRTEEQQKVQSLLRLGLWFCS